MNKEEELTSMGRLFLALGVDNFDVVFEIICKECPLETACKEVRKDEGITCNANRILGAMASTVTNYYPDQALWFVKNVERGSRWIREGSCPPMTHF